MTTTDKKPARLGHSPAIFPVDISRLPLRENLTAKSCYVDICIQQSLDHA